jgi:hypothetical protein
MTSAQFPPPLPPGPPAPGGTPPAPVQPGPPTQQGGTEQPGSTVLATIALSVGIVAFLFGWVTIVGGLLGLAGIILGVCAIRAGRARVRSIIALCLSGIALLCNLILAVILIVTLVNVANNADFSDVLDSIDPNSATTAPGDDSATDVDTTTLETPCYSVAAPAAYINNQSKEATAACATNAELWGEYNADGTVKNTGVGAILGSVNVEAISTVSAAEFAPDGTLEAMMVYLDAEFMPGMGTQIGQPENLTIDGTPATLTRFTSDVAATKTKALLVLRAPEAYQTADKDVQFFLLSVVTPEDNGDAIIDAAVSSWTWQ